MVTGGSILVLGRRRLYPIRPREEQDQVVPWYFHKGNELRQEYTGFFPIVIGFFEG